MSADIREQFRQAIGKERAFVYSTTCELPEQYDEAKLDRVMAVHEQAMDAAKDGGK
jgi:hypothetical protein